MTDIWDLRAVHSVLRHYFVPDILDDEYRFTRDQLYYAPVDSLLQEVKDYVAQLPLHDSPEVCACFQLLHVPCSPAQTFGLHTNADITFQRKETAALLDTIVSIQPRVGSGDGVKKPEDVVLEIVAGIYFLCVVVPSPHYRQICRRRSRSRWT